MGFVAAGVAYFPVPRNPDMNRPEFKAVLRNVVLDVCPSDKSLFEIEADALIEEEIAGKKLREADTGDVQSRFGFPLSHETLSSVDTYIKLIVAAVGALKSLGFLDSKPKLSADQIAKLQTKWQQELQRAGIPAPKSAAIVLRFSKDLVRAATQD
jgi:hypothetical protein